MPLQIREARRDEAELLSALALRSKGYWGYSADFLDACRDELTLTPEQIAGDRFEVYVGQAASSIAGYYAIELNGGELIELEALFVEPEYIGKGIGRSLVQHAIARARDLGGHKLLIQGDPNAREFYEAAGGREVAQRESDSVPGRYLPVFEINLIERGHKMQIQQNYTVPFSVEVTFNAWVSSDTVIAPATGMDIDPAVGGHYRLLIESPEFTSRAQGHFLLFESGSRVRYSWQWDGSDENTEIDVTFSAAGDSCEICLTHSGFLTQESRDNHASGWDSYINGLISFLEGR